MANIWAAISPKGIRQGDIVQLLYEIGYVLENDATLTIAVETAASTDFTITVVNKAGSVVGAADYVKVLQPNGFNWAYAVQYLYEIVAFLEATVTDASEADFTGQIMNLYHTVKGGTTTRNWFLYPQGVSIGDFCQALYEIVECLIDDVAGPASTDFTLDVEDKTGNLAGVTG